jgi:hypothetical protein
MFGRSRGAFAINYLYGAWRRLITAWSSASKNEIPASTPEKCGYGG